MSERNWIVVRDLLKEVREDDAHRFVVPIYQRVFAWGPKEVERFLTDLYEHFVINQSESDYYLGVITVVNGSDEKHKGDLILVDGQQRLTCIMLFGALIGLNLNSKRLVYEARQRDQDALNKIFKLLKPIDSLPDSGNDAMDAFFRRANELDAGESDTDENRPIKICELRKKKEIIAEHLKLFVSILPKEPYGEKENIKQQNRYFEKMNSGGKQLEPHEILKVRICSKCSDANAFSKWNKATDFSRRYDVASDQGVQRLCEGQTFENLMFSKTSPGDEPTEGGEEFLPSRLGLLELPMFLLHVLANCNEGKLKGVLNEEWRGDKLIEAFPAPEELTQKWADDFIRTMESYRLFLDEKIIHLSFDANRNVYDYKFEDDEPDDNMRSKKDDDNCKTKLRQFQAMLFVASQGRQGKQKWLLTAYNEGDYFNGDYNTQFMKLKEIDKSNVTTEQGSMEYIDNLCYSMQSRWLFWRLDYLLWERVMDGYKKFSAGDDTRAFWNGWNGELSEKNIRAIKSFRFHTGRSIEHLHPQTDDDDAEWNEGNPPQKDMFYNLCLLTSSVNSRLSNDSVAVKLARVKELAESGKAGLQSIKMLFMYRECQGLDSKWTPKIAQIHLARMREVLLDSYLYRKD